MGVLTSSISYSCTVGFKVLNKCLLFGNNGSNAKKNFANTGKSCQTCKRKKNLPKIFNKDFGLMQRFNKERISDVNYIAYLPTYAFLPPE